MSRFLALSRETQISQPKTNLFQGMLGTLGEEIPQLIEQEMKNIVTELRDLYTRHPQYSDDFRRNFKKVQENFLVSV